MRHLSKRKKGLVISSIVIGVCGIFLFIAGQLKHQLIEKLELSGNNVTIKFAHWNPIQGFVFSRVLIQNGDQKLTCKRVVMNIDYLGLISRQLPIRKIKIREGFWLNKEKKVINFSANVTLVVEGITKIDLRSRSDSVDFDISALTFLYSVTDASQSLFWKSLLLKNSNVGLSKWKSLLKDHLGYKGEKGHWMMSGNLDFRNQKQPIGELLIQEITEGSKNKPKGANQVKIDYIHPFIKVLKFDWEDFLGTTNLQAQYDLSAKVGTFYLESEGNWTPWLEKWFPKLDIQVQRSDHLKLEVKWARNQISQEKWETECQAFGSFNLNQVHLWGEKFDSIQGNISWHTKGDKKRAYIDRFEFKQGKEGIVAKISLEDNLFKLEGSSNLKAEAVKSLSSWAGFYSHIEEIKPNSTSQCQIDFTGQWGLKGEDWKVDLGINLMDVIYRKALVDKAYSKLAIKSGQVAFNEINCQFSADGQVNQKIKADSIIYQYRKSQFIFNQAIGDVYLSSVLLIFAPKYVYLVKPYQFNTLPSVTLSGVLPIKGGRDFNLIMSVKSDRPWSYQHLKNQNFLIEKSKADILFSDKKVNLLINATTQGGQVSSLAEINQQSGNGKQPRISGQVKFEDIQLNQLKKIYKIQTAIQGILDGRLDFSLVGNQLKTLTGKGEITANEGSFFSVFLFGRSTELIPQALRDLIKVDEAKKASANFDINQGSLTTKDLKISGLLVGIDGRGTVDLLKQNFDMQFSIAPGKINPLTGLLGVFKFKVKGSFNDHILVEKTNPEK